MSIRAKIQTSAMSRKGKIKRRLTFLIKGKSRSASRIPALLLTIFLNLNMKKLTYVSYLGLLSIRGVNWTVNPNKLSDLSSLHISTSRNALYGVPWKPRIYLSVLLHTACQLNNYLSHTELVRHGYS